MKNTLFHSFIIGWRFDLCKRNTSWAILDWNQIVVIFLNSFPYRLLFSFYLFSSLTHSYSGLLSLVSYWQDPQICKKFHLILLILRNASSIFRSKIKEQQKYVDLCISYSYHLIISLLLLKVTIYPSLAYWHGCKSERSPIQPLQICNTKYLCFPMKDHLLFYWTNL